MAEIEIQRKQGASPWAWLLGLIVLGLIAWAVWAAMTGDRATVTASSDATTPVVTPNTAAPTPGSPGMPLAAALANPDAYFGKPISGMATVVEVIGDRALIIEQDGARMYVVKSADIAPTTNLAVGNTVSLTGTVVNPDNMQDAVPGILDVGEPTLKTLQGEPAFIHATSFEMVNA